MNRRAVSAIRAFEPADAPGVQRLLERCRWGPYRDGLEVTTDDLIRGLEENAYVAVFVAVTPDGEVVGLAAIGAISVQRASRPGGVIADHLVVHPDFRIGAVTGRLMSAMQSAAAALGYTRFDAHVDRDNVAAMAAYRRLGLRRIDADACSDGGYLCENFLVGLVPYLREAGFTGAALDDGFANPRYLLRALRPARRRDGGPDAAPWRGTTVVEYEFSLEDDPVVAVLVDRETDSVVAVRTERFEIEYWPDRRTAPTDLVLRVRNLGSGPLRVDTFTLAAGEERVVTRPAPAGRTVDDVVVTIHRDDARPPLRIPLRAFWRELSGQKPDGSRQNDGFSVDEATGVLSICRGGRVVAMELWPDVGPPFPGGYKSPIPRAITRIGDDPLVLTSPANGWLGLHPTIAHADVASLRIERRFTPVDDGVLRIDTAVVDDGDGSTGARWLRTWPRVLLDDPRLVLADPVALVNRLPHVMINFEFVRSPEVASDPARHTEPWSAFVDGDEVVGLVFPDASEVRFDGRWMPSVLYAVPPTGAGERVELPPYLIVAGAGGADRVARAWQDELALVGR